jgi:tetratricopeptide (TPR) repeat protein
MKKELLLAGVLLTAIGCGTANNTVENPVTPPAGQSDPTGIRAHGGSAPAAPAAGGQAQGSGSWTQGGSPIDTTSFDAAIAKAETSYKAKSGDQSRALVLAEAYVKRATALTEARQYASALGDYRRALKFDPNNAEAKRWVEEIIAIYNMLKKSYPAEGQEPAPLPFERKA